MQQLIGQTAQSLDNMISSAINKKLLLHNALAIHEQIEAQVDAMIDPVVDRIVASIEALPDIQTPL